MELVSIIIPIYKVEQYLTKCLNSILNQSYTNWECLLIDDCSPDNSALICKKFCEKDKRFKYIKKEKNEGLGFARNTGLDNASGDYISFVDSDDYIQPNFYTTLLPYARQYGAVRCAMNIVNAAGKITSVWHTATDLVTLENKKFYQNNLYDTGYTTCALYKRSIIEDNKIRFTNCPYREDSLFSFELFAHHGKLYILDTPLYNYYKREDNSLSGKINMTKERILAYLQNIQLLIQKIKPLASFKYLEDIIINNTSQSQFIKQFCAKEFNEAFPEFAFIDLVLPYVDASDPTWISTYNKYSQTKIDADVNGSNRFRGQGDFFRYFFRCVEKNMPWINNIFLLVQSKSQVPTWLDQNKVKIITHNQFIPKDYLPTFNSGTIEMFLWNIPELSNRFIYANDDFFMLNKVNISDFFEKNICKINFMQEDVNKYPTDIWRKMCQNNYNLIYNTKASVYERCDHEFRPYIKSEMANCFKKYERQIKDSISQFRSSKNLTCFMFNLYLKKNGLTTVSKLVAGYLDSNCQNVSTQLAKNYVCLNDTAPDKNIYTNNQLRIYFYSNFAAKSKYELNDTNNLKEAIITTVHKQEKVADGKANYYLYF